jgi:hypothetical protein
MDFINGVKYDNEDVWPDCDLEETPFSADQGMAGGAGLRSCNSLGIVNVGLKDLSSVTMDDVYAGAMELNPTATADNTYAVELRNSEYAVLRVKSVSQDQMTVCFEWGMLGDVTQGATSGFSGSGVATDQQGGGQTDDSCIGGVCSCEGAVSVPNCVAGEKLDAGLIKGYYCGEVTYNGRKMCKFSMFVSDETRICAYFSPIVPDWYSASGIESYHTLADGTEIEATDVLMLDYCGDMGVNPFA